MSCPVFTRSNPASHALLRFFFVFVFCFFGKMAAKRPKDQKIFGR
jgi:hypothetical protein